jgi:AmiR/NasT family two-component response regulator
MQVASVVSGLFFKEKITAAVNRIGVNTFCENVAEVEAAQPNIILVDLEHPHAHLVLQEYGKAVIAFGPHLRSDLLAIAKEFGAKVYPRSVFFGELDKLLHQHL